MVAAFFGAMQADWVENDRTGETPQREGKEKQAGWGRKWRNERKSPTGS